MSIRHELESLTKEWHGLSIFWKVILSIALVSQTAAIASIGDTVFAFKGFIATGIDFYIRLTQPLIGWLYLINLRISRDNFDSLVVIALWLTAAFRGQDRKFNKYTISYLSLIVVWALGALGTSTFDDFVGLAVGYIVVAATLLGVVIGRAAHGKASDPKELRTLLFFFGPILIVCVIAAASEGLFRATS